MNGHGVYPDDLQVDNGWVTTSFVAAPYWSVRMIVAGYDQPIEKPCPVFLLQTRTTDMVETRCVPGYLDGDGFIVAAPDVPGYNGAVYGG